VRNNAFFGHAKLVCVLVCAPRAAKLRHYANPPAGLVVSQRLCCVRVDGLHFVFNYVKRLSVRLATMRLMLLLVIFFITAYLKKRRCAIRGSGKPLGVRTHTQITNTNQTSE